MSRAGMAAYRGLVYETDGFVDYYRAATPIAEIADLKDQIADLEEENESLEEQLSEMKEQLAGHFETAAKEQKSFGTILDKTQTKIAALQSQVDAIDAKLAERKAAEADRRRRDKARRTMANRITELEARIADRDEQVRSLIEGLVKRAALEGASNAALARAPGYTVPSAGPIIRPPVATKKQWRTTMILFVLWSMPCHRAADWVWVLIDSP